jgi:hypothetical protein
MEVALYEGSTLPLKEITIQVNPSLMYVEFYEFLQFKSNLKKIVL